MGKNIGVIISSEHPKFNEEYYTPLSKLGYEVKKYIMNFVSGHGFESEELDIIKKQMIEASNDLKNCDAIMYARSYGAFYEEQIQYIRSFFSVPVIFSTESIINHIKRRGKKVYTITPYNQERHELEIKWLLEYKITSVASMSLGRDNDYLKYIKVEDLNAAINIANHSIGADSIYIACTFMPGISGAELFKINSAKPVISANGSMLDELLKLKL